MASVIRVLSEHRVGGDVVRAHTSWSPSARGKGAGHALRAAQVILAMSPGELVHVHLSERGSFVREGALLALARRRGLPTVATIHGAVFSSFARRHRRLAGAVLACARRVTCLDEEVLALVGELAPGTPCEIVPNPVSVSQHGIAPATEELVLFAGEIGLRKGVDVLVRAWALVARARPDARCLLVGPLADFVPPTCERLELGGSVQPGAVRELIARARVVVLPARAEGMPMVLTEAMSVGRPFVSTPVGGIPALAEHGGLLVPVGDHEQLAERLIELLASPRLAARIGERGRRFCLATRSVEVLDTRLSGLYRAAAV
ncbi:MAG TPA: glycosyltransferase family 4 protein [Solirubrobacteraceae bacterium]|jgi:glycosyltransferase involved in cell wall biosynthesis